MLMFDLHLHTYYSDGLLSPGELVAAAKQAGMRCIAITDHDGICGISEGLQAGRKHGVRVIPGIEFSAELWEQGNAEHMVYMHMLGYGIDPQNAALRQATEEILAQRRERNGKMLKALRERGFRIDKEDLKVYPQQTYIGKPSFARALARKGYVKTTKEAFQSENFLRAPEIRRIHRTKIPVRKAIELIHEAGGKAVLAHPMKVTYKGKDELGAEQFLENLELILQELIRLGLDGMECYYGRHSVWETEQLLALADRYGLLVSAGTDFHGLEFDPSLQIGNFAAQVDLQRLQWIRTLAEG